MNAELQPTGNQEGINWQFIGREMTVFGMAATSAYTQLYYHVTRFAREALVDLPMGELLTRHAGNMGPSADVAMWGGLASEVVVTIGQSKENKLITQIGKKLMPALVMAQIYWLNVQSESLNSPNPEGNADLWAGVVIGGITLAAIRAISNRIRKAPHEISTATTSHSESRPPQSNRLWS